MGRYVLRDGLSVGVAVGERLAFGVCVLVAVTVCVAVGDGVAV